MTPKHPGQRSANESGSQHVPIVAVHERPIPRADLLRAGLGIGRNLSVVLAVFVCSICAPSGAAQNSRPDIVLIVTDDQRYDEMQFMPLTDSLIGLAGVRFTNAFSPTPLCCPSRAGLLTGLYSHNHRVLSNTPPYGGAPAFNDRSTLGTWLQTAGYRTALIGKYLNEYDMLTPWPYVPPGWDVWRVMVEPHYWQFQIVTEEHELVSYRGWGLDSTYSTNVLAKAAVQFIIDTPAKQPLFLYFAPFAPHYLALPAPQDNSMFDSLPGLRPPSYNEADVSDKPAWVRALPIITAEEMDSTDAFYRRQVESLQAIDRGVRDIVGALEVTGRLTNSVILFTSDNGMALGEHRWAERKECAYEECIHVPLLVRASGIPPRIDAHLISNVDVPATIAAFAGAVTPGNLNGKSFKRLLVGPATPWRYGILLEMLADGLRTQQGVRTARYKYVEYQNGDHEFYDLELDPYELQNAIDDPTYAGKIAELRVRLENLRRQ